MLLDFRLDFQEHWKSLLKKVNKTVALLRKFQNILPRSALLTIHKCFVRAHLDYGDIIYDKLSTILSTKRLNPFNMTLLYLSQVPLEELEGKNLSRTRPRVPLTKMLV